MKSSDAWMLAAAVGAAVWWFTRSGAAGSRSDASGMNGLGRYRRRRKPMDYGSQQDMTDLTALYEGGMTFPSDPAFAGSAYENALDEDIGFNSI